MSRLAVAAAAAVAVAAAVTARAPVAGSQATDVRVSCKTRALDVYFWPHGHPYVKAYRFTKNAAAHLEVYRRGSTASRSFFVFLSASSYNYANSCDLATNPLPTRWGRGPSRTTRATRRVRCSFPVTVQIKIVPRGGPAGGSLRVLRGASASEVLDARVAAKGSTLTYDTRYCTATPVPSVA